ncbi:MAG: GGDEF domain-containing protein [Proteobacteria bacterium]|nr:GGDEF domain-containing protein [Pseudomonadota bacterium]
MPLSHDTAVVTLILASLVVAPLLFYLGAGTCRSHGRGLRWWGAGILGHALGYGAFLFRGLVGHPMAVIAFDSVHLASLLALLAGTLVFLGRRPWWWALGALWAAASGGSAFAVLALDDGIALRAWALAPLAGGAAIAAGALWLKAEAAGAGHGRLAGIAFLAWGVHRLTHPLVRDVAWLLPWGLVTSHALMLAVGTALIVAVMRGVIRRAESAGVEARENHERVLRVIDASPVPMVIARLADGALYFMNRRAAEVFGTGTVPAAGASVADFFADRAGYVEIARRLNAREIVEDLELPLKTRAGQPFWAETAWRRVAFGEEPVVLATIADVTERKRTEQELRRQATTDALTGVFNRRRFLDLAEREFARARRYRRSGALLVIDFDNFKAINDSFGHVAGDVALRRIADAFRERLREHDLIGRLGGDEFAVLMPETDRDAAGRVAERLLASISALKDVLPQPGVALSLSVGVTDIQAGDENLSQALERADSALYMAKDLGRNCVVVK